MATKVHRVRYYNPKPHPINCISFNNIRKHLAVARDDATIEIWDLNYVPYLIKCISGVENGSVEALGWVKDRLLSTGLGGALVEWDLDKYCVKSSVLLTGYASWCLDVSPDNTLVAVGTEQGYVNLYNVENDDIVYKRLFDKQEGRILCCKFNKAGNILVTGSINTIRVWNVETGHATTRMSVNRRGNEVIVWCLAVLSDNTVISGDSHGRLTFWDGNLGDQIESYMTHKADILAIVVSNDERNLFCSGVDPVIVHFVRPNEDAEQQTNGRWVKHVQRHIHGHDVRDLVLNEGKLISVGIDGYLSFSSYPPKWVMRMPHMLQAPRSSVCASKKFLLLRYNNYLEVWKLGSYAVNNKSNVVISESIQEENVDQEENNNLEEDTAISGIDIISNVHKQKQSLEVTEKPVKLVSVQSKGKKQIRCCELSPTGEFIVYSTASDIRMLKLECDDEQCNVSLSKVVVNGVTSSCDRFAFTEDSRTMAAHCSATGALHILHADPEAGATVVQTISIEKHLKSKSILQLFISKKSQTGVTYLVVADTHGEIAVWTQTPKKFEHYVTLPQYHCVPSALTVDNERDRLIVTYVNQKIVEYDLTKRKFTDWPGAALPPEWLARTSAVESITTHPNSDAIVFQDGTSLWIMDRKPRAELAPVAKKKFSEPGDQNVDLRIVPIKYLAGFHWIGKDEAVMLEVLPENILSQLPPIVITNKKNR